ncbi:hypothetical protein GCM10022204_03310 [Microlunatus aurantiacus]|uniref:Uncharacterized protein n=1 Tax=Microlunatus aurantiacus TaxID=446786 RepID=A0ABP7CM60_9ACTN
MVASAGSATGGGVVGSADAIGVRLRARAPETRTARPADTRRRRREERGLAAVTIDFLRMNLKNAEVSRQPTLI